MRARTHAHTHSTHARTHKHTHTHTHEHTDTRTHTNARTHKRTHKHARAHAHAQAHGLTDRHSAAQAAGAPTNRRVEFDESDEALGPIDGVFDDAKNPRLAYADAVGRIKLDLKAVLYTVKQFLKSQVL